MPFLARLRPVAEYADLNSAHTDPVFVGGVSATSAASSPHSLLEPDTGSIVAVSTNDENSDVFACRILVMIVLVVPFFLLVLSCLVLMLWL